MHHFVSGFLKYIWIFFLEDPVNVDKNGIDIKLFKQRKPKKYVRIYFCYYYYCLIVDCQTTIFNAQGIVCWMLYKHWETWHFPYSSWKANKLICRSVIFAVEVGEFWASETWRTRLLWVTNNPFSQRQAAIKEKWVHMCAHSHNKNMK